MSWWAEVIQGCGYVVNALRRAAKDPSGTQQSVGRCRERPAGNPRACSENPYKRVFLYLCNPTEFVARILVGCDGGGKTPWPGVGNHLVFVRPSDSITEAWRKPWEGRTDPASGSAPQAALQAAARWQAG